MKASVLFSGVATFLALAGCKTTAPGEASQTGGVTSTGGEPQSGGGSGGSTGSVATTTSSGGTTAAGGATGNGGSTTAGGTMGSGGSTAAGGATGNGGSTAAGGTKTTGGTNLSGGSSASGGSPLSGGTTSSGGQPGTGGATAILGTTAAGGTTASYQGPCDVLASGCAEAYSVARAMTASYTGPLFQLGLASDKTKTLDVGQTSDHKADMAKWSDFCGSKQSNCVVSKIYAQIHSGSNDLLPAVWKATYGPDCSAGGYTCAAKFTIETATGLPILTTIAPQEYALSNDGLATGINGGSKAIGIMYNGQPVPNQVYCCGTFGLTHPHVPATDTYGTDFMAALAYGWRDSGGCCIAVNCGKSNTYCVGAEEEENNDLYDYGTSPVENAMVVTQFDPNPTATHGTVITYLNGKQVLSKSPPAPLSRGNYPINAGTAIHLGGGGDLSQPDPVLMREALITNNVMTASEVTAMKANLEALFSSLKFPSP